MKKNYLLSILLLFTYFQAQCQWGNMIGENVPLTFGEGLKTNVLIEPGPDDSWYVSYTLGTAPNFNVVHLTRVDSTGMILWDNIIHDLSTAGSPRATMISDMNDGVIMTWIDRRESTTPLLYANRINTDGDKMWGDDDVAVGISEGQQSCPKIISDGDGGAIITCDDEGPGNGDFNGIYAYHVNSSGAVGWRTFLFPNNGDCENYSICEDGEGGVVVFTTYGHVLQMENQVRGMRLDGNGEKVWADETIELGISLPIGMRFQGSQDNYSDPKITYHPDAGIYLVYFKNPMGGSLAPAHRGQLIDLSANIQWSDEDVILNEPSELSPDVNLLTDLDGNLYFNYHTETQWTLQKVLPDGSLPWTIDGIAYSPDQTGSPDALHLTTCNDVMLVADGIDDVIVAARIDESGDMVYAPPLLPISVDGIDDNHRNPVMGINENDRVLAVWVDDEDVNDTDWNLKMHGFHKDGTLGNVTSVKHLKLSDFKMYPNPVSHSEFLVIETSEMNRGNVKLLSLNGKTILEQNQVNFSNGYTRIAIPNALSRGIYFIQIIEDGKQFTRKVVVQ